MRILYKVDDDLNCSEIVDIGYDSNLFDVEDSNDSTPKREGLYCVHSNSDFLDMVFLDISRELANKLIREIAKNGFIDLSEYKHDFIE